MLSSPACMRDDVSAKAPPKHLVHALRTSTWMKRAHTFSMGVQMQMPRAIQFLIQPYHTNRRDGEYQVIMHFIQLSTS